MTGLGDLARYRVLAKLGSGGMATVDLAEDTLLGRQVALKRMHGEADVPGLTRLRREALVGASFSHPNLVSVYDVLNTDDGHLVIVMEYIEGETLRQVLSRRGRLPADEALPILSGVAAGLDAINERGIVHRDVKPSNILLGSGAVVKLADLGIASAPDRTRITTSGAVLGSLSYMAPEQLSDAPVTRAIDVYALAAVSFEVLAGVKARREGNPVALAHAISTLGPPSIKASWPDAPPGVDELLQRAMARDPHRRPRSAGEFLARLGAALEPEDTAQVPTERVRPARPPAAARIPAERVRPARPPAAVPPSPPRGRARTGVLAAALLGLAAVVAALIVVLSSGGSPAHHAAKAASRGRARHRTSKRPAATSTAAASATTTTTSTSTAEAAIGPVATGSPVSAVERFYGLAAAHHYSQAWALADPAMQGQLGGYQAFQSGQAGDRSITFSSAKTVSQSSSSAQVSIATTSVRTDGTKHCSGTVDLVPGGSAGAWLLHEIQIDCT